MPSSASGSSFTEKTDDENKEIDIKPSEEKIIEKASEEEIVKIPLKDLRSNPYQPRKVFSEKALKELQSRDKIYKKFDIKKQTFCIKFSNFKKFFQKTVYKLISCYYYI